MKTAAILTTLLAAFVAAAPVAEPEANVKVIVAAEIAARQSSNISTTADDYDRDGCKPVIFFFARGSTEIGNIGSTVGPATSEALKLALGAENVAVQGIDYAAALVTNFLPGGADYEGISELHDYLNDAASRCPNSVLLAGGYSQGAALCHRAIENLSPTVKDRIAGVVTYGDTMNYQDNGQIPNFPEDKTLIICNTGDLVCVGTLAIFLPHFDYVRRVPEAVSFLAARARAAGA